MVQIFWNWWVLELLQKDRGQGEYPVRFHFQVRTGTHVMVTEAAELGDSDEARIEAAKRIGLLLHAHAGTLWTDEDWQMDVTDDTGLILFVINVSAMRSSATLHNNQPIDR